MSRRRGPKKQQSKSKRDGYLRKNYGISEAEYLKLFEEHEGVCWICRRPPKPGKNLSVDHDHKVAKEKGLRRSVRGTLCFQCNRRLIGRRRKEHAYLYENAASYLRSGRAQEILGG